MDQPRDAVRFPDGKVFVTDDGYHVVRVFGPDGQFVRTIGRVGEGPGEFMWVWGIDRYGDDAIMVQDYYQYRATVFDTTGTVRNSINVSAGSRPWPYGAFQDSLIMLRATIASSQNRPTPGVYWDSVYILLYRAPFAPIDTLGKFPMRENVGGSGGETRQRYFSKYSLFAIGSDGIYRGSGQTYEITLLDASGAIRQIVRRRHDPVTASPAFVDTFKTRYLEAMRAQSRYHNTPMDFANAERRLEEGDYSGALPAYSAMVVDQVGNLWVKDYRPPYVPGGEWSVFDCDGRWLGGVAVPGALEVVEIGADYLLGIETDDMGLAYVRVHELSKPGR